MSVHVTMGRGLTTPQGKLYEIPDDPVLGLVGLLESQPAAVESWWSPHQWQGDRRSSNGWSGACSVGVDVDYHNADGEHAVIPEDVAAAVMAAATGGVLPGNVFHATPRGFRAIFVFPELCTDRERYRAAALEAGRRVGAKLKQCAPGADLRVDESVLQDLARLLFSPNAIVRGKPRTAPVIVGNRSPVSIDLLAPMPEVEWSVVPLPVSQTIADAIRKYNAEHARTFPAGRGSCPICGHNDCFGQLKSDPSKWSCFSANHEGGGRRGAGCFTGDVLDIDAHAAGVQPIDLLRRDGYLTPRPAPTAAAPAPEPIVLSPDRSLSKSYANACWVLRDAASRELVMGSGALEFNVQSLVPSLDRKPITDEMISATRERCENVLRNHRGRPIEFSRDTLEQAVGQVARERPYHPVRNYLLGLQWDGVERLDHMTTDVLNIDDAPLPRTMLRKWMLSAVARALRPGCKVDTVLILVGPQGAGKSRFFSTIAGPGRFADSIMDLSSKDAYLVLRSAWIFEWGELESMQRARASATVKAFLSSCSDNFRAPYARTNEDHPRACVIVGSTNDQRFLTDPTGGRRYWTVETPNPIDISALIETRDQLWAEAVVAFHADEKWWLTQDEERALSEVQEKHAVVDVWEDAILSCAEAQAALGHDVTVAVLLKLALDKPMATWSAVDMSRVASILTRSGWTLHRPRRPDGTRPSIWIKREGSK
jgi:hypothetical protein